MENSNDLISPAWMDKDFFLKVIKSYSGDSKATLKDFVIKPSLAIGTHCMYDS